jgi:hypothetical protein
MVSAKHLVHFFLVILITYAFSAQAQIVSNKSLQVKPTPSADVHGEFLLQEWDANKPTLVAFKDPRCPYCVKAFKNKEVLDNYNVFVFWSPILGSTSQRQVDTFFKCEHPMGDNVISAVVARKQVSCDNDYNQELRTLNDEMVKIYDPRSVPQYWYGNELTWISRLKLATTNEQRLKALAQRSTMRVPWDRYKEFLINKSETNDKAPSQQSSKVDTQAKHKANLAIVANRNLTLMEFSTKIEPLSKQFNVFLFTAEKANSSKFQEFLALNNITELQEDAYYLEGKRLSKEETKWMLSL